jgi:dynein heavy chain
LNKTKAKLASAHAKLQDLQHQYERVVEEEASLEARLALCKQRANNAAKLTRGLEEEALRWQARLDDTLDLRRSVVGDTVVAVATACYAGPYPPEVRDRLVVAWCGAVRGAGITMTPSPALCRLSGIMSDPVRLRQWRLCGLPVDVVAEENAIMLLGGHRPPARVAAAPRGSPSPVRAVSPSKGRLGGAQAQARVSVTPLTPLWPLVIDPQGQASR